MSDIRVYNHGSIIAFSGETETGRNWLAEHLPEDCPMMGAHYCVEALYADDIVDGALEEGLEVL